MPASQLSHVHKGIGVSEIEDVMFQSKENVHLASRQDGPAVLKRPKKSVRCGDFS